MTIEEIKEKLDKIITSPYGVKNVLNCLSKIEDKNEKIDCLKDILNGGQKIDNTKLGGANG